MIEKPEWIENELTLTYSWQTQHHNQIYPQLIKLEKPTVLKVDGDCATNFGGVCSFPSEQFINNHYFLQSVAKVEIEEWAKIVDRTIGVKFLKTSKTVQKETVYVDREKFTAKLTPNLMHFSNQIFVKIWRFNIAWKDKNNSSERTYQASERLRMHSESQAERIPRPEEASGVLSSFNRYYIAEDNAKKEMKQWILVRERKLREEFERAIAENRKRKEKFYLKSGKNRSKNIISFFEKHPNKWFSSNDVYNLVFPDTSENPSYLLYLLREFEAERNNVKKLEKKMIAKWYYSDISSKLECITVEFGKLRYIL